MKKSFSIGLILILISVVSNHAMSIHRDLIFGPEYYDSWIKSLLRFCDFEFLKEYLTNPTGLFLFIITIFCFIAGWFLVFGGVYFEAFLDKTMKQNKRK